MFLVNARSVEARATRAATAWPPRRRCKMPEAGHDEAASNASSKGHAEILQFFSSEQMEGPKTVQPHELITMTDTIIGARARAPRARRRRPGPTALRACAGTGSFSKVLLVEVRLLASSSRARSRRRKPLTRRAAPPQVKPMTKVVPAATDADDGLCPELHGFFAMKMMRKTEIVRLKEVDHVKNESLIRARRARPPTPAAPSSARAPLCWCRQPTRRHRRPQPRVRLALSAIGRRRGATVTRRLGAAIRTAGAYLSPPPRDRDTISRRSHPAPTAL